MARPDALVLWEAQFGDFVNGAQTVIDEFITSGETKWRQQSGVVLLLPHGYEGQGPDHSSARIERFLTMCADDAFVVAQPSTPASYFHLLRRHSLGEEHRPLVVFTPKSMLKRKEAASQPGDFTEGMFQPLHRRRPTPTPDAVETLLLCSGRITWDLMVERAKREDGERVRDRPRRAALPRAASTTIKAEIASTRTSGVRWVQDEPGNMGPWPYYRSTSGPSSTSAVEPITRPASLVAVGRHRQAARRGAEGADGRRSSPRRTAPTRHCYWRMYFTDRGIEELDKRRGDEEVTLAWLAERLQEFTDTHPEFETAVERFATWLARLDDPED